MSSSGSRRVVGSFDDPRDAEAAVERLRALEEDADDMDTESVETNAPEDVDAAFIPTEHRGESIERPPDVTVAVDVPDEFAEEAIRTLVDADAEMVVSEDEPHPPAE